MPKTWRIGLAPVRGLSNENVLSPDQKLAKHWLSAWLPGLARSPGPGGPERPGSRLTAIRLPSLHCGNAWQTLANCLTRHSTFVNQSIICIFTIWYNLTFYEIQDWRLHLSADQSIFYDPWAGPMWTECLVHSGPGLVIGAAEYKATKTHSGHLAISDGQYPGPWSWHRPANRSPAIRGERGHEMRVNQNPE